MHLLTKSLSHHVILFKPDWYPFCPQTHGPEQLPYLEKNLQIILTYIGCWDLISDVIKRPASEPSGSETLRTPRNSQSEWDRTSNKALSFLVMNIDQGLIPIISSCENATQAWTALADKFDCKNAISLHSLIKAITTLTYDEKSSLSDHLSTFDNLWARLKE